MFSSRGNGARAGLISYKLDPCQQTEATNIAHVTVLFERPKRGKKIPACICHSGE